MWFDQELYIGFHKSPILLSPVFIDPKQVDLIGNYAGSYHIADMGNQFVEYLQHDSHFPSLWGLPTFPVWCPYKRLDRKTRASVVTGNIGESIAGQIAVGTLTNSQRLIGHFKVLPNTRTPDFFIYRPAVSGTVFSIDPVLSTFQIPDWLPMEAKATTNTFKKGIVLEALKQLANYWYQIRGGYSQGVGYGIVVVTKLRPPVIRIYVFLPENDTEQKKLITYLRRFKKDKNYKLTVERNLKKIGRFILNYE